MDFKKFYKESRNALQMATLYVGCTVLDFVSSLRIRPPFEELNPFSRHADGSFWPWHAFLTNGINTIEDCLMALLFYVAARPLGWKARRFAAGLPFLYFAYGHLEAAFWNFFELWTKLHVHTMREMLNSLFGGN